MAFALDWNAPSSSHHHSVGTSTTKISPTPTSFADNFATQLKIIILPDTYGLNRTPDAAQRKNLVKSCKISFARVFKLDPRNARDVAVSWGRDRQIVRDEAVAGLARGAHGSASGPPPPIPSSMLEPEDPEDASTDDIPSDLICIAAFIHPILHEHIHPVHQRTLTKFPPAPTPLPTRKGTFPFFYLPLELREAIYTHLIPSLTLSLDRLSPSPPLAALQITHSHPTTRPFLSVNRQLRLEILQFAEHVLPKHTYVLSPWSLSAIFTTNSNNNPNNLTASIELNDLRSKAPFIARHTSHLRLIFDQAHLRSTRFLGHTGAQNYVSLLSSLFTPAGLQMLSLRIPMPTLATVSADLSKWRGEAAVPGTAPVVLRLMREGWRGVRELEVRVFAEDKRIVSKKVEERMEVVWGFLWEGVGREVGKEAREME